MDGCEWKASFAVLYGTNLVLQTVSDILFFVSNLLRSLATKRRRGKVKAQNVVGLRRRMALKASQEKHGPGLDKCAVELNKACSGLASCCRVQVCCFDAYL